jgi:hypothetical protein
MTLKNARPNMRGVGCESCEAEAVSSTMYNSSADEQPLYFLSMASGE